MTVTSLAVYSTKILKRNWYEIQKETTENFFDSKSQKETCSMHKIRVYRKPQLNNNNSLKRETVLVWWSGCLEVILTKFESNVLPQEAMQRRCVLVLMMTMRNGLLSFKVIRRNLNADGYIHLLSESAVPHIKLNYGVSW